MLFRTPHIILVMVMFSILIIYKRQLLRARSDLELSHHHSHIPFIRNEPQNLHLQVSRKARFPAKNKEVPHIRLERPWLLLCNCSNIEEDNISFLPRFAEKTDKGFDRTIHLRERGDVVEEFGNSQYYLW